MPLCTSSKPSKQTFEAMKWYFGQRHCRTITFSPDVSGDQNESAFELNLINENYEQVKYLVYLDNGSAVAPVPASGQILVPVVYADDDSAATIAGLFNAAIAALPVRTLVEGGAIEVQNKFLGEISIESYASAGDIEMEIGALGFGGALGAIAQGGGTLNTEPTVEDIFDDAKGVVPVDKIFTGNTISIDLNLNEMDAENWKKLIGKGYGDIETSAVDVVGFGTSKVYRSSLDFAGMLVGHPVRLPYSDRSSDACLWKTVPQMNSINYSGTEVQSGAFTFAGLEDINKPNTVSIFLYGDHSPY